MSNACLTVSLGLWPLRPTHTLADRDLLQESVALWLREIWSLHLAEVKLHSTVVADNMREKGLAIQSVLAELESDSWLSAILGEGQHHLITLKVLSKESRAFVSICVINPGAGTDKL